MCLLSRNFIQEDNMSRENKNGSNFRELVLVDKSFENILVGMEKFHTQIRQYSWSIENFDNREKTYGIK